MHSNFLIIFPHYRLTAPLFSAAVHAADPRRPRQAAVQLAARGSLQGG